MNWLDRFLFRDRGIIPTKRLLYLFIALTIILFSSSFFHVSWTFILATNLFVLVVSFLDFIFSARKKEVKLERIIASEMERGKTYTVQVKIVNSSQYKLH